MMKHTIGILGLSALISLGCGESEKTTTYTLDAEHSLVVVGDGAWELRQGESTLLRATVGTLRAPYDERVQTVWFLDFSTLR